MSRHTEFSRDQQRFNPFFRQESSTRIYYDDHGNKHEERIFTDSKGSQFRVHNTTSTDEHASLNQTNEEHVRQNAEFYGDNRARYGNSSFRVEPSGWTNDFTQHMWGIRSHGRHPVVQFAILMAWAVIIFTFFGTLIAFLATHPFFLLALVFLYLMRRSRRF